MLELNKFFKNNIPKSNFINIFLTLIFIGACQKTEKDIFLNTNTYTISKSIAAGTGVTLIVADTAKSTYVDEATGKNFKVRYVYVFTKQNVVFKLPSYIGKFTPLKNPKPDSKIIKAHIKAHTLWFTTKHKMLRRRVFNSVTGQIETFSVPEGTSLKASAGNPFGKHVWTLQYQNPDIHRIYRRIMFHGSAQQYIVDGKRSDNHIMDLTTRSGGYYEGLGCVHITNHSADWLFREGMTVNTGFIFLNSDISEHKKYLENLLAKEKKSGKTGTSKPQPIQTGGFYRNPMVRNIVWPPKNGDRKDEIWYGIDGEIVEKLAE